VFELAVIMLLSAHLLCVNVASGGPIVAAWLDSRGTRHADDAAAKAAVALARWSLSGLLLGAALGLVVGWTRWDSDYRSLWTGPLSYKLHWAAVEAVFSLVLMIGWWLWLPGKAGGSRWAMSARCLIALLAATNLLYHFPILFAVASHLLEADQTTGSRIGGAEFRRLMVAGEAPALAIHVVLASLAVSGVVLSGLALRWQREGQEAEAAKLARWGGRWALVPSLLQLPVGLWTLLMLPAAAQSQIMGETTLGALLLVGSLAAALWLINDLVQISMGESNRGVLVRAMTAMLVTVTLMTAMQQQTRTRPSAVRHALRGVP
jgi:hypothetical protein